MMEIAINSVARMNGFTPTTISTGGAYAGTPAKCNGKSSHIFSFTSSSLSTLTASAVASASAAGASRQNKPSHKSSTTTTAVATAAAAAAISSAVLSGGGTGTVTSATTLSSSSTTSSTPPTTTITTTSLSTTSKNHAIPSDILDDLASRFIINVPDDERNNLIRICFQIELAHWFYLDFFCAIEEKKLLPCGIKLFAMQLFQHIPFLRKHLSTIDKILEDWKNYKLAVPTYGAILISEDLNYVLLVQSYWAKSSWGFPKGKVNETEDPVHCATREVYEETGYDITGLIVQNDYIEAVINYQYTRLYIVRNVPLQTQFSPRTRNEIKCCDWFPIDSLPINKNDAISKTNLGLNANSFFMIMPFVKRLKKWVNDNRSGIETRRKYPPTNINSTTVAGSPPNGVGGGIGGIIVVGARGSGGSPTTTMLMSKNNSSNGCKKDMDSNMRIYNENIALNNGNGTVSNNNNSNQNHNNNGNSRGNNKRQRHKSMGDIDGIKLNISNNTNSNNKSNQGGTKANNNGNNSNNNNGMKHAKVQQQTQHQNNVVQSASSTSVVPPKRQLFHSQSQSGTANMGSVYPDDWNSRKPQQQQQQQQPVVSSFDLIRKEKQQQKEKEKEKNTPGNNNNASSDKQLKKINNFRIRTKSQSTTSNNNNNTTSSTTAAGLVSAPTPAAATQTKQPQSGVALKTAKEKQITSLTPPPLSSPKGQSSSVSPNEKTRSVSLSISTSQKPNNKTTTTTSAASNQILKFNPNFDSWTNFSFTKNFIANVFC